MKSYLLLAFMLICFSSVFSQDTTRKKLLYNPKIPVYEVESTCGTCMFKMEGKRCHLALRLNGKYYFIDGTSIDDYGDAHDSDGFCNAIKNVKVQGTIDKDRFKVTYFEIIKNKLF